MNVNYISLSSGRDTKLKRTWQKRLAMLCFFVLFSFISANAQVDLTASGGTPTASFTTLKGAFDAINAGTHTGTITISITGNTTETATAVLNASGSGSASYTSIGIAPSGGAARTISGAIAAGSPLIDLNGADNVTIDGLNSGGNALTIQNTTASGTSGTSTIRFIGGATTNTITRCSVLGSFNATVTTNGGNIFFSTDAVTANGNDNNTISFCDIGPAGANLSTKGIYMNGSTTTTAIGNSGNTFNGNNIFNYFGAAVASAGIYVGGGTTDNNITNNKFYQTATRTQTTGAQHSAIWITNTSGNNYQVTGNTIGYASSSATGTYTFVGVSSSSVWIPIYVNVGATTATNVSSNTITALAMSGAVSGTSSSGIFRGIYVAAGLATCNSNTIGSLSATGAITFTSSSTSASDVIGMMNFGSNNWVTNNNNIGGFTIANSSTGASNFYGIRANTSSAATWTATGNTIGGTVANSIRSTSTATGTVVAGIHNVSPAATFTGNTIRNMSTSGGTGTTTTNGMTGIMNSATSANHTIGGNTIYNLSSSATGAATVNGIYFASSTGTNLVEKNFIYDLNAGSTTSLLNGIFGNGGTATFRNNMVRLGVDGNSATIGMAISGINENAGTSNIYHNSVYIGGAPTSGALNSFAFQSIVTGSTRNYQNNIFVNARSNSGATGKHYAIRVGGTAANPAGLTSNGNIFFAGGTGGFTGLFNAVDQSTIANWRTATGQDASSFTENAPFVAATATTPDLHINSATSTFAEGLGVVVASVTDDFDGQTRSGLTPVDIGADALAGTGPSVVVINSVSASPSTTGLCTAVTRTITANTTAGGSPITSVTLNYAFNGVAQTPIAMTGGTTTGTSDWTAVIPVASPVNAAVTWSVTALDPILSKNTVGTGYQDEPLFGTTASATASPATVCNGSTITLNGTVAAPGVRSVGAGALSSSAAPNTMFSGAWGGQKSQFIIRASELTAAGILPGNITSLSFETTSAFNGYEGFALNVGQTTATVAGFPLITSGLTQVYTGTGTNGAYATTNGVNTLPFSTPINWDGTSNLVVTFCWAKNPTATSTTGTTVKYDTTSFVSAAIGQKDSTIAATMCPFSASADFGTTSTGSVRPKFTFGAQAAASGLTYSWVDNTTSSVVGTTNPLTVTPTTGGTYTVTMSTAGGCSTTATTNAVTVQPLPSAPTATNGTRCGTGLVTTATVASTTGLPTPTFRWYAASTGGAILQNGTSTSYTTSISATTTLYVTEYNGTCESSPRTPITLTVTPPPAISVAVNSGLQVNCGTGSFNVNFTASSADTGMTYSWTTTSGTAVINSGASTATLDVTVTESADFIVTGIPSDASCNPVVFTFPVSVYPLPNATVTTTATGVCPGTSATINSGLSAGNFTSTAITYSLKTAPVGAVTLVENSVINVTPDLSYDSVGDLDDSGWSNIPVGFSFNFFGTSYSNVSISTNGTVFLGTATSGSIADFTFTTLPSTTEPFNMVAVLAMDNNLAASGVDGSTAGTPGGAIKYWTEGTAPNRRFVISYENVREYADTKVSSAQAVFYETLGVVEVNVTSSTNVDRNKLVGINNGNGTIGVLAYASGTTATATNPISTPFAYRFSPPANYTITWSSVGPGNVLTTVQTGTNVFSITVNPTVTTVYDLRYTNQTTGCSNIADSDRVTMTIIDNVAPTTTAAATPAVICNGQSVALSLTGNVNSIGNTDGLTYQWQVSTDAGATWTNIAAATAATLSVTPSAVSQYRALVAVCGGTAVPSNPASVTYTNNVDTTTPATRCGIGTATIYATTLTSGATLNWYAAASGGSALASGTSFTTPTIAATTTYYVAAETTGPACSSPRVPVVVTVTAPPAINLTGGNSATICNGTSKTLITDADVNYDVFNVTPATGSYAGGGVFTFTPTANTVYTVTASQSAGSLCATSFTYTVTVNSTPVSVSASASTVCLESNTVNLTAASTLSGPSSLPSGYCSPDSSGGAGSNPITSVTFNTLSNTGITNASPYYTTYPATGALTTTVVAGQTYALTVSAATSILSVWIDYDRSGTFETTEWTQPWTSASSGTVNITIPSGATLGATKMRLRSRGTGNPNADTDMCTAFFSGVSQDYTINITGGNNPAVTYSWTSTPSGYTASGASVTANPTVTTTYHVVATDTTTGCASAPADVTVTVNTDPIANITGGASTICLGSPTIPATVDFDSTVGAIWESSNAAVATVDSNGVVTPLTAGTTVISAHIFNPFTGCTTYAANPQTVTVYAPLAVTTHPASASVLDYNGVDPTTTTFTVAASGSIVGYQWQVSTTGVEGTFTNLSNGAPYSGVTTATLSIANATTALSGLYYRAQIIGNSPCATPISSNNALLTVSDVSIFPDPSFGAPICGSGDRTITVGVTGPTGTTQIWQYSSDNGDTWTTIDGSDIDLLTFTGDVNSTSLEIHNITSANNGWLIRVAAVSGSTVVFSNPTTIVVNQNAFIDTVGNPVQNVTVCNATAGSAAFTVTTTGGTGIQWQYSSDGSNWDNVALNLPTGASYTGANAATLNVSVTSGLVAGPHYYRARITSAEGCPPQDSNVAELIINTPTVTVTPTSALICAPGGTPVTLTAGGTAATYSWSPATGLSATTGAEVTANPTVTTTYTVVGTETGGCTNSAQVTITVAPALVPTATATPATVCSGTNAQLVATSGLPGEGTPSSYCTPTVGEPADTGDFINNVVFAEISNSSGDSVSDYEDFTSLTANVTAGVATPISITPDPGFGQQFRVWIDMNQNGVFEASESVAATTASTTATVTGNITIPTTAYNGLTRMRIADRFSTAVAATEACGHAGYGEYEDYSVNISGATNKPVYTYSWSPTTFLSDPNIANPVATAVTATTTYTVTITSSTGCSATKDVTVTVAAGIVVTTPPAAASFCQGTTATLSVVATGAGLTYQWRKGGVDVSGATSATLTINAALPTDSGSYDVVINSVCADPAVTTTPVTLTINPTPTATAPAAFPVTCSGTATSAITLNGTPSGVTFDITGGSAIGLADQTGVTAIPSFTAIAGSATLVITPKANGCTGTAISYSVSVNPTPSAVTVTPSTSTLCANDTTPVLLTLGGGTVPNSSVIFGTGTAVNATTGYPAPLSNYYGGTKHQMLIRASELSAQGFVAGDAISAIAFNVQAVGTTFTGTLSSYSVAVGNTAATVLNGSSFQTGLTTVRAAASLAVPTTGLPATLNIPFDSSFTWNGTSNIVIQTSYSNANTGTTTDFVQSRNSDPGFVSTNYYRVDGASVASVLAATVPSGSGNARPNFVLSRVPSGATTYTWTSTVANSFTDVTGTTHTNTATGTSVYVLPNATATITATVNVSGCSNAGTATVTVNTPTTWYQDADGDTYGNAAVSQLACTQPSGYVANNTDCDDTNPLLNPTNPCTTALALNVKMFIQGYYLGEGLMNSVRLNQDFVSDAADVETITVELHDATTYALVDSATGMLHTDGTLSVSFNTAAAGSYYIALKGTNMVQTWSATPQTVASTPSTYDFTTSASQAYGDNMVDMGSGVYAVYSGDITQDDSIDLSDYATWETDFNEFAFGEFATDLNGDGSVDLIDYSIWETNFNSFIFAFYPF